MSMNHFAVDLRILHDLRTSDIRLDFQTYKSYFLKNSTESLALFLTLKPPGIIWTKLGILTPIIIKPRRITSCQDRRLKGVEFPAHYAADCTRLINIGKV